VPAPQQKEIIPIKVDSRRRSYEEAILFACQQQEHNNSPLNIQTKRTVEALGLEPFSLVDKDDYELNTLAQYQR
jgi:hypothetical protein